MTRGGVPWLVRALTDWALSVGQGQALITYRSPQARNAVIEHLQRAFLAKHLKTDMLNGMQCAPMEFVSHIFRSDEDVLFVLNADRLIFDKNKPDGPSVVNFNRERIVERPGVQIWFMWQQGAIRFANELPDLNRFFLFREELTDEPEAVKLDWTPPEPPKSGAGLGPMYLERAHRAAEAKASPERIWLELGLPAIEEFMEAGDKALATSALNQISEWIGSPEPVMIGFVPTRKLAKFYQLLGTIEPQNAKSIRYSERAAEIYRKLVQDTKEVLPLYSATAAAFLRDDLTEAGLLAKDLDLKLRNLYRGDPVNFKPLLARGLRLTGMICANAKLTEKALPYFEEALSLTDEPELKAEIQDSLRQLDPTPAPADTSASPSTNPDSPAPTH